MAEKMTVGLSSCPNDTFIFHALLHGLIDIPDGLNFDSHMCDVEKLNGLAKQSLLPVTKISLGVVPEIIDQYALLAAGSALGWGCGPLIVAKRNACNFEYGTVAIPGRHTTAAMLLELTGKYKGPRQEMVFDEVMPAVDSGKADLGVIIHEGRFTYQNYGLEKVLDLGEWWENKWRLPLPLGAIAVRRDLGRETALKIQKLISMSLEYAWQNPEDSKSYIRAHAQELDDTITQAHIKTFVTEYSRDLGPKGRQAIVALLKAACRNGNWEKGIFADEAR